MTVLRNLIVLVTVVLEAVIINSALKIIVRTFVLVRAHMKVIVEFVMTVELFIVIVVQYMNAISMVTAYMVVNTMQQLVNMKHLMLEPV